MTKIVRELLEEVQDLSPLEQLELIQAITQFLQLHYQQLAPQTESILGSGDLIPDTIKRAKPITDVSELAADWWPEDETADDINAFIAEQRALDHSLE
jgi:hypothetical protein